MQLTVVRRLAVAALLVGLLIGGAVGWAASGDDTTNAAATPAPIVGGGRAGTQAAKPATAGEGTEDRSPTTAAAGATADEDLENVLARALNKGVSSATKRYDGTVEAAILADGWSTPVVRATSAGRTGVAHESSRRTRMWSMSKAVTAVALLERVPYGALAEPVKQAMTRALTASENCPQRRIVLELQRRYDGPGGAQEAVRKVLADAGADPTGVDVAATPPDDPDCQRALTDGSLGWNENPRAAALQLGTAEWTIGDAARFAHHLAAGGYTPRGAGKRVLQLLRLAKARSTEGDPSGF
ncbi:hypothetical protein AB0L40_21160, partial [Patulibacter sp. NPDC049589]|uniref:hypothetical protein n=1 Tax=Patulibacter sp. NPDC049589 TaxID=3154731 RepID=UPI0034228611